jgi:hypothetical protein
MAPTAPNRRPVLYPRRARPRQCPAQRRLWLSPRFSSHSFVVSFRPVSATPKMSGKAVGVRVKADPRPRHAIKCPACRGCQTPLPPLGTARLVTLPAAGCSDEAWPPGRLPRRPSLPFRGRWPRRRWPHRALRSCAAKTETRLGTTGCGGCWAARVAWRGRADVRGAGGQQVHHQNGRFLRLAVRGPLRDMVFFEHRYAKVAPSDLRSV